MKCVARFSPFSKEKNRCAADGFSSVPQLALAQPEKRDSHVIWLFLDSAFSTVTLAARTNHRSLQLDSGQVPVWKNPPSSGSGLETSTIILNTRPSHGCWPMAAQREPRSHSRENQSDDAARTWCVWNDK